MSPLLKNGFVIKRAVFRDCLELYPMEVYNAMMEKMNRKNRFLKKNSDFIRRFTAGVKVVEIDSTGRLLIPKNLIAVAGIKKEVVLSSAIDMVEIWDKTGYESVLDETAVDFEALTEEVMGTEEGGPEDVS